MKYDRRTPTQQIASKRRKRNPWCKLPPYGVTFSECEKQLNGSHDLPFAVGLEWADRFWLTTYNVSASKPWSATQPMEWHAWHVAWVMTKRHVRAEGHPELARLIDLAIYEEGVLLGQHVPSFSPQWFATPEATKQGCVDAAPTDGVEVGAQPK